VKPSLYVAVIDKCRTDRQGMSEQIVDQRELTMSVLMRRTWPTSPATYVAACC
jgi:hypothetical protein